MMRTTRPIEPNMCAGKLAKRYTRSFGVDAADQALILPWTKRPAELINVSYRWNRASRDERYGID
jgi:hypothetical protein